MISWCRGSEGYYIAIFIIAIVYGVAIGIGGSGETVNIIIAVCCSLSFRVDGRGEIVFVVGVGLVVFCCSFTYVYIGLVIYKFWVWGCW